MTSQSASFEARFASLDAARQFVRQAAIDCGMDTRAVYAVELAVDEAMTNIIEHAYGGECQAQVHIDWQVTREALLIQLRDHGQPFNPLEVPEPDMQVGLAERDIGGLGMFLIRRMMDDVQYVHSPDVPEGSPHNALFLTKLRQSSP